MKEIKIYDADEFPAHARAFVGRLAKILDIPLEVRWDSKRNELSIAAVLITRVVASDCFLKMSPNPEAFTANEMLNQFIQELRRFESMVQSQ